MLIPYVVTRSLIGVCNLLIEQEDCEGRKNGETVYKLVEKIFVPGAV